MNIITKPEIKEICDGEIHDFILELVEQALEKAPQYQTNRRKELCQALLAANRVVGKRDTMCKNVGAVLKTWNASHKQVSILKKYGFSLNRGNNGHYKLRWNDSPYFETLSGSPSDHCSGRNASTTFKYNFF